jgi:hypothetical protein
MKSRILALAVIVLFATGGWECFNEEILIPVDLKLPAAFNINPGPATSFNQGTTVRVGDYLDDTYEDNLKGGRLVDIQVWMVGSYAGRVQGTAFINGTQLLTFDGTGTQFSTPQSLLGDSPYITSVNAAGMTVLNNILKTVTPSTTIQVAASGTLSQAVTTPITVYVNLVTQVDSQP